MNWNLCHGEHKDEKSIKWLKRYSKEFYRQTNSFNNYKDVYLIYKCLIRGRFLHEIATEYIWSIKAKSLLRKHIIPIQCRQRCLTDNYAVICFSHQLIYNVYRANIKMVTDSIQWFKISVDITL